MQCPRGHGELAAAERHGLEVKTCPTCKGMWLEREELAQLENEAFHLDEHAKGTLVFDAEPSDGQCPECGAVLQRFNYRAYDLVLEVCPNQHGYWLDQGEDDRVLALMRKEEASIDRSMDAEEKWTRTLRHLRSGSLLDKLRELLR
ncbi:MAG TPA: zf-TFIIB domain-containing protein [Caulobacteraceae bacterium]|nr:zf-TFIIB domain-containing protein [Caulobacteraceae bacterium]